MILLGTLVAGTFSLALGAAHWWVPRIFAFEQAIGSDGDQSLGLGSIGVGRWRYVRRRADLTGLTWVMSNAASYVLMSIGLIDLAWATGDRSVPVGLGAAWVAGWWALRASGQFALGRRRFDIVLAASFLALAAWHVILAAIVVPP